MYDRFIILLGAILFVLGPIVAPSVAWAQKDPAERIEDADEYDEDDQKAWSIEAQIQSRVGQGTFVDPANDTEYADQVDAGNNAWDRANLIFSLAPSYKLGEFTFDADISVVQWLTAGGGQTGSPSSGGANSPQEFALQDISVGAAWDGYLIEPVKTMFIPRVFVDLPTSRMSRTSTMLFAAGTELVLSRSFLDRINLSLVGSAIKYQHSSPNSALDPETIGVFRSDGNEMLGNGRVRVPGFLNAEWLGVTAAAISFDIIDDLSASISYALINQWSYATPDDEYTAENASGGRGHRQSTSSTIGLNYDVNDNLSVGAGTYTVQQPLTSDQKSMRFPFWNMEGAANNYSAFTMSVTGKY